MKRTVKIVLTVFLLFLTPAVILKAQDKKNEKHIKIVIADKDGTKVEIDTLMRGDASADSIKIKEGEVVIIRGGKHATESKSGRMVTWASAEGNSKGAKYIYINEEKNTGEKGEKNIEVKVTTDEKDNTVEKTKYIIAKDGMVITVEGNDDAKVKDLVKDIETKLGVSKTEKNMKKVVKEEPRETNKK
jgi:hypothetical protein